MKKRTYLKTFALTLIIVTLMITSLGVIIPKVFATGRIYIVPPDIDDPGLGPGSTFIVNATAENQQSCTVSVHGFPLKASSTFQLSPRQLLTTTSASQY